MSTTIRPGADAIQAQQRPGPAVEEQGPVVFHQNRRLRASGLEDPGSRSEKSDLQAHEGWIGGL